MHSTNYYDTLIEPAEDCPANTSEIPPLRGEKKSVANLQYEMLAGKPYAHTSDEVLFAVFAERKGFDDAELEEQRHTYFSKGQPCFRASPLTKRYGWGVHADGDGKIALLAADSAEYQALLNDSTVTKKQAMRSKRK